jgi:hypothetical protein
MNFLFGYVSAFVWFLVSAVTAAGTLLDTDLATVNLIMAASFASGAAFLVWRTRVVSRVRLRYPENDEVKWLLRVEAISSCFVIFIGLVCVGAALFRVLSEDLPVFG